MQDVQSFRGRFVSKDSWKTIKIDLLSLGGLCLHIWLNGRIERYQIKMAGIPLSDRVLRVFCIYFLYLPIRSPIGREAGREPNMSWREAPYVSSREPYMSWR